jgi:hypothetical protein
MNAEKISGTTNFANLNSTSILNHDHPCIQNLIGQLRQFSNCERHFVQSAHRYLSGNIKPVYTLDEFQPASETLRKRVGSCSQRMACLEALSRGFGVATRIRGLWVDGCFWYPRFRLSRPFIPNKILLAWPQFFLESKWIDFDELFGGIAELAEKADSGFSNAGETLFEAIEHTAVDFTGKTQECGVVCSTKMFDLSKFVVGDEGFFDSRDELFAKCGSLQHSWLGRVFEATFGGRKSA